MIKIPNISGLPKDEILKKLTFREKIKNVGENKRKYDM